MQRLFLIIAACLLLAFAGCGSDSDTETSAGTEASAKSEEGASAPEKTTETTAETTAEEKAPAPPQPKIPAGNPPKKLVVKDVKKGSGATAKAGDEVSLDYVGVVFKTKKQFEANWGNGEPLTFELGVGQVIKGWDQGVQGMKVGGERELIIPPALAYGPEAIYPSIPANSTLVFRVKLLKVK